MTGIFAIFRNSYLQSRSSSVNPRIINRSVALARGQPLIDTCEDFEPPWHRMSSEQPNIPVEKVDVTRRALAFGRLAIPKLRREIHDPDVFVVLEALLSLCDLVHDPEKAFEALDLDIPKRVCDKLLDPLDPIREAAATLLKILAQYEDGRVAIAQNKFILENLILGLGDAQMAVRLQVAACFEMLARSWMTADVLVEAELIEYLLPIIDKDESEEILEFHLDTLKSLLYDCGKCIALKNDGFKIFMKYLTHDSSFMICKALDCLALLITTKKGKKLAIQKNLLKDLNAILHYGDVEVCKRAANVLTFCTVKTRAKHLAAEYPNLPKCLIGLARNPVNVGLQMFCLKALTNICEHPLVRKQVREKYLDQLEKMKVDKLNVENKKILMKVVAWIPQHNT